MVNFDKQKEMVIWVTMLGGFHLILRKSNLVPLSQVHDTVHNIARTDVRYYKGVMVLTIRWSKTNQFGEYISKVPVVANKNSSICLVKWTLRMVKQIPAGAHNNLFSYFGKKGLVPVTYRDLMVQMRKWLDLVGVNSTKYSSH